MDFDPAQTWYHGSPLELTTLREGSTITQKRELARIFSHKPTCVSVSDTGQIKHNGTMPGYLYTIEDEIQPEDVVPHPRTTMMPGDDRTVVAPEGAPPDVATADSPAHPGGAPHRAWHPVPAE